jgi:hypothetical protein
MKRKWTKVPTEFAPETRYAVVVEPAAPFRATLESELERLKDRLLREWLATATAPEFNAPLRRASNEAAALAWTTPVPLLVLPELLREKAEAALRYVARQVALHKRCRPGMIEAA